ncbi:MAG: AMP-binding protein [Nitrospiraceae bacterium]|nr:AMP-binding protein [Nitrospiraceae bacterium]
MSDIPCPIAHWAQAEPERLAILTPDTCCYTYSAYHDAVGAVAAQLSGDGVQPGDVVAVSSPSPAEQILAMMGIMRLGAIAAPVALRIPSAARSDRLRRIGARRLLTEGGIDIAGPPRATNAVRMPTDHPATIVFTSGTSGEPKAALHAYGNHYHAAQAANRNMPLAPGDRWLLSLGLHHVAGIAILFRCMVAGAAIVAPDVGGGIVEAVERYGVTHCSLVSTQLYRLLGDSAAHSALAGMKGILLGGGAISEALIRRAVARGWPIHTSYGLTETAAQIAATEPGAPLDTLITSGRPLQPGTIRIAEDGEILVRGDGLFQGYLRDGRVERPEVEEGWFPTGDLGRFDSEGRLHVGGRKDNRFVCGGENIQPEGLERALCRVPGVVDALVVPIEDAEFGHIPVAFLRMDGGPIPSPDKLRTHLVGELERFSIPKRFLAWPKDIDDDVSKADRAAFARRARGSL